MSCCPVTFQSDARKPPPSLGVSAASALNVASDTAEAFIQILRSSSRSTLRSKSRTETLRLGVLKVFQLDPRRPFEHQMPAPHPDKAAEIIPEL